MLQEDRESPRELNQVKVAYLIRDSNLQEGFSLMLNKANDTVVRLLKSFGLCCPNKYYTRNTAT